MLSCNAEQHASRRACVHACMSWAHDQRSRFSVVALYHCSPQAPQVHRKLASLASSSSTSPYVNLRLGLAAEHPLTHARMLARLAPGTHTWAVVGNTGGPAQVSALLQGIAPHSRSPVSAGGGALELHADTCMRVHARGCPKRLCAPASCARVCVCARAVRASALVWVC